MSQSDHDRMPERRRKRRRALLAILLSTSLLTLGAGAVSLAVFTDTETEDGTWTAGNIILGVTPAAVWTADDIMPGDSGDQDVTVENNGTGDLRYAMTASATNADGKNLAGQLDLTITAGTCAAPGATLFSGKLDVAAFGSAAQGPDAGDRDVLADGTDDLCFSWSFPLASGNGYQDATTTATFTFDAEQTANNP
jgi:predicted ribosomally synthesized peptide with SipW-like signal peptide